jgi:hypothetical protein
MARLPKICPTWDLWFENIPSGNPDVDVTWATLISPLYMNSTMDATSEYGVSFKITIWKNAKK